MDTRSGQDTPASTGRSADEGALLKHLRSTALPGAETVTEGAQGDGHGYYWLLAPWGERSAAWVVPARERYGLGFLEKWHPARDNPAWKALAGAYADGSLGGRRGVHLLRVPADRSGYWEQFGWRNSIPPVVVAYVGTPRRWRKVVAGLVQRETGWPAIVVKFPLVRTARKYILDEVKTLETLARDKPGLAPRPLALDTKRAIASEEALIGDDAGNLLEPLHLPFLCALRDGTKTTSLMRHRRLLLNRMDKVKPAGASAVTLSRVCGLLEDSTPLPAMWVHGDLHPGNMVLRRNGLVMAVDWAFARRGGLPYYDIARAQLAGSLAKPGKVLDADADRQCLEAYGDGLGVPHGIYVKVAAYYAARALLRHLREDDRDAANIIRAKLDNWLDIHA